MANSTDPLGKQSLWRSNRRRLQWQHNRRRRPQLKLIRIQYAGKGAGYKDPLAQAVVSKVHSWYRYRVEVQWSSGYDQLANLSIGVTQNTSTN